MKSLVTRLVWASVFFALTGSQVMANPGYEAELRRTSYGIPHIKADNWGSLGYGYGYAYAADNICVLAREVVEANGQQALYFGSSQGRINSDLFYTLSNSEQTVNDIIAQMDAPVVEGIRGFAAGYNRYLSETGVDNIAADCRNEVWVRAIDERDLFKVYYKLILRASGGVGILRDLIVSAVPPAAMSGPARNKVVDTKSKQRGLVNAMAKADLSSLKDLLDPQELGSNMYALGSNATQSGRGMVLGNPHFPWDGPLRWYQVHLTIPGEVDVMGASLQGVPLVNIGFTDTFAWSHTVSPADRFTLFELALVPGNPTQYFYDGVPTDMEVFPVSIQVDNNGVIETVNHTFYRSVQGWILDIAPLLGFPVWNTGVSIFAIGDANADNYRAINQFYRMNLATNLDEFVGVLEDLTALPWVHTVAASESGTAFYGDLSVIPNVSAEKLATCSATGVGALLTAAAGLKVLDGADSMCGWTVSPDAAQPGAVPSSELPTLTTQDYVTNSNDNHWLTNPNMPITGIVPTAGSEDTARSLRTRLGLKQIEQRLDGSDGQGAPGYTIALLKEALFGSRNYAAELIVDDLVQLCLDEGSSVVVDTVTVDLTEACSVLGNWDKRQNNDSFGAHIFLEFLESVYDDDNSDPILTALWDTPFDVNDPVNTPRGLKATDPADRAQVMNWLGRGVKRLTDLGLPMSIAWGDLQYTERGGSPLPIHGGRDGSGMFSIISANLSSAGYTPVTGGNSYMQVVTFDDDGPIAEALLSYSQSSDVASPHYSDQTVLYSNKQWVTLPFKEADILADPNYTTQTLIGIKDSDGDGVGDDVDNCLEAANAPQRDTDNDGFGNRCDPDFDNSGVVNFLDLSYLASVFNTTDPDGDLDGDGAVNFLDFAIFSDYYLSPPGPAAPPSVTTFTADVQPIYAIKCSPCHTGMTPGTFNFAGDYGSNLLPAEIPQCAGLTVGECSLVRIQNGEMPFGQGCTGDAVLDEGNSPCLTAAEQVTVQAWIDDGLPE